jgi:uncharacterized phiE125 gp8 family phage protein
MELRRVGPALTRDQKLTVVTVAEVKRQAVIEHNEDDELIADDIEAAYDWIAQWLRSCCILTETWEATVRAPFPSSFEVPLRPLRSEGFSFSYGSGEDFDVLPASDYGLDLTGPFASVQLLRRLPSSRSGLYRIRFEAGFGPGRDDVPAPIRKAIKLLVAHWYRAREATGEGRTVNQTIEFGVKALCAPWRLAADHS